MDEVFNSKGYSPKQTKQAHANRARAVPDRQSLAHASGRNDLSPCRISSRKGANYDRGVRGRPSACRTAHDVSLVADHALGEACRFTMTV